MTQSLDQDIRHTFHEVKKVLALFNNDNLNKVPFEGSWTAAQVAEHMILALSRSTALFTGPIAVTDRDPSEKIKIIEDIFLDMEKKFKSPEFILPSNDLHTKEELIATFDHIEKDLLAHTGGDLTGTCTLFELPGMGHLTKDEWLHFYLAHTQRHTQQLKNILQVFTKKPVAKNL